MFLIQLERIIASLTNTASFALPYWDYQDTNHVTVPAAFTTGALADPTRAFRPFPVAAETWHQQATFTRFAMAGFQSPLDPLFWIHHCNIDRLWETWRAMPGHANPTVAAFANTSFSFPDPDPAHPRRALTVSSVLNTQTHDYRYDSLSTKNVHIAAGPAGPTAARPSRRRVTGQDDAPAEERLELLGATERGGSVNDERVRIAPDRKALTAHRRRVTKSGSRAGLTATGRPTKRRVLLRLENVGMDHGDASSAWNVYAAHDTDDEEGAVLVGTIAPFGLAGLTAAGGRETITFDVTAHADELLGGGPIVVTFKPAHDNVEGHPYWDRAALYTTAD
jgi:hypothetical protein